MPLSENRSMPKVSMRIFCAIQVVAKKTWRQIIVSNFQQFVPELGWIW
jgi:hypothetical protein